MEQYLKYFSNEEMVKSDFQNLPMPQVFEDKETFKQRCIDSVPKIINSVSRVKEDTQIDMRTTQLLICAINCPYIMNNFQTTIIDNSLENNITCMLLCDFPTENIGTISKEVKSFQGIMKSELGYTGDDGDNIAYVVFPTPKEACDFFKVYMQMKNN